MYNNIKRNYIPLRLFFKEENYVLFKEKSIKSGTCYCNYYVYVYIRNNKRICHNNS